MTPTPRHRERGLTLTEITIVFVLAAVLMTGLVAFYLNSQAVWLDGSSQAITQREATLVLDAIRARARGAAKVQVGGANDQLDLLNRFQPPESTYSFWLADSALHEGYKLLGQDLSPMTQSKVTAFVVAAQDSELAMVRDLSLMSAQGRVVRVRTSVRLVNGRP